LNLGKQNYRYKLTGYDDDWHHISAKVTEAVYKEVPIGKYTFTVAASVDDYWNNDLLHSIEVVILPPWWKTNIAIFSYVIFIVLVLIITYKIIKERIALHNKLLIEETMRKNSEEATKSKLRFFTNISHEFRTPLTLIAGATEKMMTSESKGVPEKSLMNVVHLNTKRMLRLINQLLDFTKIESDQLQISVAKVDVSEFFERILGMFIYRAERKSLDFKYEISDKLGDVWFDETKFETALYNLISNSFKFTRDGGAITVTVSPSDKEGWMKILIKDTGKGMTSEQMNKIFDRFYQVDDNVLHGGGGTGIGLSIVKEYIKLHKGAIEVKSQFGKGTEFLIDLPVAKELYDEKQIVYGSEKYTLKTTNSDLELTAEKTDEYSDEIDGEIPVVMVVEDNVELRDFIVQCLTGSFSVLEAKDGYEGFEIAQEHSPNLIVSDVRMPRMDGVEMCKKIKTDMTLSHIPVILLTAKAAVEDQLEGIESGADIYLTKPFNPDVLEARIKQLINQRKKLAEYFKNDLSNIVDNVSINPYDQKFLNEIIEIIESEISNIELNVQFICEKIGFNHQQLYRKIKAITGQSVNEFIRTIRLKHSAKLLKSTNLTVSEVMYDSGFSNRSYFSKCFKTQFDLSPKEYRQNSL